MVNYNSCRGIKCLEILIKIILYHNSIPSSTPHCIKLNINHTIQLNIHTSKVHVHWTCPTIDAHILSFILWTEIFQFKTWPLSFWVLLGITRLFLSHRNLAPLGVGGPVNVQLNKTVWFLNLMIRFSVGLIILTAGTTWITPANE